MESTNPPLRRNRNYQLAWFGEAISSLGDIVFTTSVVLWVGAIIVKGHLAPAAVSGVLIAAMVPLVLLAPIGGVYADRWNRRTTMLITSAIRAAVVGALVLLPVYGDGLHTGIKLTLVYAAVLADSAAAQFFNPCRMGLLAVIVNDSDRERVSSITQATSAATAIIGPPLAAPLLVGSGQGVGWALAVNAASFVVAFAALAAVRVSAGDVTPSEAKPASTAWQDFTAGLSFIRRSRVLVTLLVVIVIVTFGAGAINVLDLFFVTGNLHLQAQYYGLIDAALGFGTVVGAVAFSVIGGRLPAHRVLPVGLIVVGVGAAVYSRSTALWFALIVLFCMGVPLAAVNSMAGPLVFRSTPRDMLGRVFGVITPVQQAASFGSIAIATWLASTVLSGLDARVLGIHFGPIDTIFLFAGIIILCGGVWALANLRTAGGPVAPAVADEVDAATATLAHPVVVEQREPEAETATKSHSD
jgi:MFS family permease